MYVNVIGLVGAAIVSAVNPQIGVSPRLFRLNFQEVVRFGDVMDSLIKSVVFGTAIAVACLALGIGVNATIFSVVDGVIINPYPYPESDRLIVLHSTNQKLDVRRAG